VDINHRYFVTGCLDFVGGDNRVAAILNFHLDFS
jgi:hypothetical protein